MKRRAVIVGNDIYFCDAIKNLRFAVDDAYKIKSFLETLDSPEPFEVIDVLRERAAHEVMQHVKKVIRDLTKGDLFVFYFSGHGVFTPFAHQHLLLCPEAQRDVLEYSTTGAIPHMFLDRIAQEADFNILFILDACRTELLTGGKGPAGQEGEYAMNGSACLRDIGAGRAQGNTAACVKLWSCNDGERAEESPEVSGGVFTHALISVMQSQRRSSREIVVDESLMGKVIQRMNSYKSTYIVQRPAYHSLPDSRVTLYSEKEPVLGPGADMLAGDEKESTVLKALLERLAAFQRRDLSLLIEHLVKDQADELGV